MKPKSEPGFVKVLKTDSLTDIALIKSTLEGAEVEYFIQGEYMDQILPVEPAILMVVEKDVSKVVELLKPLTLKYSKVFWADLPEKPE